MPEEYGISVFMDKGDPSVSEHASEDVFVDFVAGPRIKDHPGFFGNPPGNHKLAFFFATPNLSRFVKAKYSKPAIVGGGQLEWIANSIVRVIYDIPGLHIYGFPKRVERDVLGRLNFMCLSHLGGILEKANFKPPLTYVARGEVKPVPLSKRLDELHSRFSERDFKFGFTLRARTALLEGRNRFRKFFPMKRR